MADNQRIHPVHMDPEAGQTQTPTAPLVPQGLSKSDDQQQQQQQQQQYPPFERTIPVMHSKPPKKRSRCCKCLCWTFSLLLLLLIIIAVAAGILYLVFQPKIPKYSINGLRITEFNLGDDNSLNATFNVNITARNPNKKIGIYYESGSHINVWYTDTKLCEGSLPKFYQGHRNTTVLNVTLTGQTQNATGLVSSLQEQEQTGSIPLNLRVKVPVRIKLGKLKLMKMNFRVRCRLVVDSLSSDNTISIKSSSCKFRFRL